MSLRTARGNRAKNFFPRLRFSAIICLQSMAYRMPVNHSYSASRTQCALACRPAPGALCLAVIFTVALLLKKSFCCSAVTGLSMSATVARHIWPGSLHHAAYHFRTDLLASSFCVEVYAILSRMNALISPYGSLWSITMPRALQYLWKRLATFIRVE